MISTNDFNTGLTIELDGEVYQVLEFQHSKSGRGSAFVRSKLRNVEEGYVINKTFKAGEKVETAHVDKKKMQFLYWDGSDYIFMDNETYEQFHLSEEQLGDKINYLKENMELEISLYQKRPIDIDLPTFVELEVEQTPPGVKGNTVSGGTKRATLETGLEIQVPLFINEGDIIKIDTRSGDYVERISK
ncbi:elongation factor P [Halanaerobium sp. Z-7514]|uniref:Elongation factor P n=1 Tax=Halanaerobium polyolivorans TaxID=2886943 RepID=A0AAW4WVZ9_9FIRM|nr:elongation factor P [Halanaerobium polyolivorans]MCC3143763.1 elongation factor P [Halanaerobium polyolivorans]RQD74156.1 MAG: elongation factor P [Halanaerobium sp. MSAO_Bac5]